jgi:hypothetical protein
MHIMHVQALANWQLPAPLSTASQCWPRFHSTRHQLPQAQDTAQMKQQPSQPDSCACTCQHTLEGGAGLAVADRLLQWSGAACPPGRPCNCIMQPVKLAVLHNLCAGPHRTAAAAACVARAAPQQKVACAKLCCGLERPSPCAQGRTAGSSYSHPPAPFLCGGTLFPHTAEAGDTRPSEPGKGEMEGHWPGASSHSTVMRHQGTRDRAAARVSIPHNCLWTLPCGQAG